MRSMRVLLAVVLELCVFGRPAQGEGGMVQLISLDGQWLAAKDPENIGREKEWFRQPVEEAEAMRVPWLTQDVWPDYFDTVWYWREVEIPQPAAGGRILLRFWSVYYYAEVWLNGRLACDSPDPLEHRRRRYLCHSRGGGNPSSLYLFDF